MAHCMKLFTWTCHPTSSTGEKITCRFNKSLYGLKQASRTCGFQHFLIKSTRFQQFEVRDKLLYSQDIITHHLRSFLIYVDDILWTVNYLTEIQRVKDCLLQQFRIKDIGDLKYFLGIEFSYSKAGIYMS